MPQLFNGFYLTGEGQAGTYHPWHWLLYRTLPVSVAFELELLSSYPFMLSGYYWFLRRRLPRSAAALGGLAFTFSGFSLLHFVHPNAIAIVAHIPWSLGCIDRLFAAADRRGAALAATGLALLTGSQILLGYPQYVWFSLVAEAGMVVFLWKPSHSPLATPRAGLAAEVVGLMLGGGALPPMIDGLDHAATHRPARNIWTSGSLHPLNVVQLIAPYLYANRVLAVNTARIWALYRRGAADAAGLAGLLSEAFGTPAADGPGRGPAGVVCRCGWRWATPGKSTVCSAVAAGGKFSLPCRYLVLLASGHEHSGGNRFRVAAAAMPAAAGRWRGVKSPPAGIVVLLSVVVAITGIALRNGLIPLRPLAGDLAGASLDNRWQGCWWPWLLGARARRWWAWYCLLPWTSAVMG